MLCAECISHNLPASASELQARTTMPGNEHFLNEEKRNLQWVELCFFLCKMGELTVFSEVQF
jgi:hypothetical protein